MGDMKEELSAVIGGIVDTIEKDNEVTAQDLLKSSVVSDAVEKAKSGDLETFYFLVMYPISNAIDGLSSIAANTHQGQFIFKHSQFIERQFEQIIRQFEGSSCCADKSRTVMRRLFLSYERDEEIVFDYEQKYTYHLPKKVFTNHSEIVSFFEGVYHLYYGKPEKYLKALAAVHKGITNET